MALKFWSAAPSGTCCAVAAGRAGLCTEGAERSALTERATFRPAAVLHAARVGREAVPKTSPRSLPFQKAARYVGYNIH